MRCYLKIILCLYCVCCTVLKVEAVDLSGLEDVKITLFDSLGGHRWGDLSFQGIEVESPKAGPFEVDALQNVRLSHLMLRFTNWPINTSLSDCLKPLAAWGGGKLPDRLPSFRIECKGQWALMIEDLSLTPCSSQTDAVGEKKRYRLRARKAVYIRTGQAKTFINPQIIYNAELHEVILASPNHELFHIQLSAQSI